MIGSSRGSKLGRLPLQHSKSKQTVLPSCSPSLAHAFPRPAIRAEFQHFFLQTLHLHLPTAFPVHLSAYFLCTLHSHPLYASAKAYSPGVSHPATPAESPLQPSSLPLPDLAALSAAQIRPSPHLARLGILARFAPELTAIAQRVVRERVEACRGEWEEQGVLANLRDWARRSVGGWWQGIYEAQTGALEAGGGEIEAIMKPIYSRLDYCVCKSMSDLR